jgi:hypothetical protein
MKSSGCRPLVNSNHPRHPRKAEVAEVAEVAESLVSFEGVSVVPCTMKLRV